MALLRYFAAAAELAGRDEETRPEPTVGELRRGLALDHPALGGILDRCALLVDGSRTDDDAPLRAGTRVDVLPPYAGG